MSTAQYDRWIEWQERAACAGDMGSLFYPPMHQERKAARVARERRAKAICAKCVVRTECLGHALRVGERYGIWGGLTDQERKNLATIS